MATQNAVEFLKQMVTDTALSDALAEGYKNLLCRLGSERGFAFSPEELAEAARQVKQATYDVPPASGMRAQTHLRAGWDSNVTTDRVMDHWHNNTTDPGDAKNFSVDWPW